MSINVYFKDEVKNYLGFKISPATQERAERTSVNDISLFDKDGRLYAMWGDDSPMPDDLCDFVEEITQYEWIPRMGYREAGIYRYESADCELIPKDPGGKRENPMYWLKMRGTKLEDIQALLYRIKVGTIRPDESYEGHQQGKSRNELEQELRNLREHVTELENEKTILESENSQARFALQKAQELVDQKTAEIDSLHEQLKLSQDTFSESEQRFHDACEKNTRLRQLARLIKKKPFYNPLVLRSVVATRIDEILDEKK